MAQWNGDPHTRLSLVLENGKGVGQIRRISQTEYIVTSNGRESPTRRYESVEHAMKACIEIARGEFPDTWKELYELWRQCPGANTP